jgi:flagellar basal body-associated protein FliL
MAVFGLPGGAEWLIIIGIIVLLFVPGLAAFWLGYFMGRKNAAPTVPDGVQPTVSKPAVAQADPLAAPTSAAVSADPPAAIAEGVADDA